MSDVCDPGDQYGMNAPDPKPSIAARAAESLPAPLVAELTQERFLEVENGHLLAKGWHVGWVWGTDGALVFLDVLTEHRHPGSYGARFRSDGTTGSFPVPSTGRLASADPDEDARLEREFVEEQRAIVDDLRSRGLLPPSGQNQLSLEINERLRTDRLHGRD